jgi:dephospho-CoA kinase
MGMIIGVTGLFGSGKSTVAKLMGRRLGYTVINADQLAWQALKMNKAAAKRLFGTTGRKELAEIVFDNRKKLMQLQKIIHPHVLSEMEKVAKIKKNAILDVPLLIEVGAHKFVDVIIIVKCSERVRIKRLMKKGFTHKEIMQRTQQQMPIKKKLRHADYVVDNSRSLKETEKQVDKILQKISNVKPKFDSNRKD